MSEQVDSTSLVEPEPAPEPAPPPPPITLDDIMNSVEFIRQKELSDKALLEGIGTMSNDSLKNQLVLWGTSGFPNAYVILQVPVQPPTVCSDGITRGLSEYIQYCSGKGIHDHVQPLQDRVVGINVSFSNFGSYIGIVVSKP